MTTTFTHTHEERRLCNEWLKDPLVNPRTGMPIELKGPTYVFWQQKCKQLGLSYKPIRTKELSYRKCQEWRKAPHINPETGKQIMVGGTLYKSIERRCKNVTEKPVQLQGAYYPPDRQGLVPAVRSSTGVWYIVRYVQDSASSTSTSTSVSSQTPETVRLVYGSLNALTYRNRTKLVYFKNTWDYRQGYYRPLFTGGREPPPPVSNVQSTTMGSSSSTSTGYHHRAYGSAIENGRRTSSTIANPDVAKRKVDTIVNLFVSRR